LKLLSIFFCRGAREICRNRKKYARCTFHHIAG